MSIWVIKIEPEASPASIYPIAFKTMEEAVAGLKKIAGPLRQRSDLCYQDEDYTYYALELLEVKE